MSVNKRTEGSRKGGYALEEKRSCVVERDADECEDEIYTSVWHYLRNGNTRVGNKILT